MKTNLKSLKRVFQFAWWAFLVAATALALPGTALAADSLASAEGQYVFDKAEYYPPAAGGEKKGDSVKGALQIDSASKIIRFLDKRGAPQFSVPYPAIKGLLYERTAKPRYAAGLLIAWPLLFTKSKKHYLTIQFADASGQGQFATVRLDKSNFRKALARIEADTGIAVQREVEQ